MTEIVYLLENAAGTDFEWRWELLREANQYLVDNAVVVPIVQEAQNYLINPKIQGYTTRVLGTPVDITYAYFTD